jgi:hypothetical protein
MLKYPTPHSICRSLPFPLAEWIWEKPYNACALDRMHREKTAAPHPPPKKLKIFSVSEIADHYAPL